MNSFYHEGFKSTLVVERKQSKPHVSGLLVISIALLIFWFRYAFGYRLRLLNQRISLINLQKG
jgi:hypothetical protein